MNDDIPPIFKIVNAWNIKNIILHQDNIGRSSRHDSFDIHRNNLAGKVFALPVKNSTVQESVTGQPLSFIYQLSHCIERAAKLIDARTRDCTANFEFVREAIENGFCRYNITIAHFVDAIVHFLNSVHFIFLTVLTHNANRTGISIGIETTSIFYQGSKTFVLLHLEAHRTFYFTLNLDQNFIGRNNDNIAFLKADIILNITFHYKLVNVNCGQTAAVTNQPDIPKASDITHSACTVKGMKNCGKRRQGIGTRLNHLTHYIDLNRTDITQSKANIRSRFISIIKTIIDFIQSFLQITVSFGNS